MKRGRVGATLLCVLAMATAGCIPVGKGHRPHVLLVGTYHGKQGQFTSIQAAVDAAAPGDWVLVAPGDYHEQQDLLHPPQGDAHGGFGGVFITTGGVHVRGMDRASVIVDGTKPGAAPCSNRPEDQQFGIATDGGRAPGRNGIVVSKADDVTIENLTVCNFLSGSQDSGNEIWWNGGADSGTIGLRRYTGRYLTATSTYYDRASAAKYGIFSSDAQGPARWDEVYANNFSDSGLYVGACMQVCAITIRRAHVQNSALGYSGTNSGGEIVITQSEFDHNQDGLDTNTQLNGDPPAPQNGACPEVNVSRITRSGSCWVFMHNYVHDNNNPNVPQSGEASEAPTGTGMTISGGTNNTVMFNRFENNGAWGVLFIPFPDDGTPSLDQTCAGTGGFQTAALGCVYEASGNALLHNTFVNNGFFGNPSNSDFGQIVLNAGKPQNCFAYNDAPDGSAPTDLEQTQPACGPLTTTVNNDPDLIAQVLCDTGFGGCPPGANYPQPTTVAMQPLPTNLPSMPDPCAGVPANAWCHPRR